MELIRGLRLFSPQLKMLNKDIKKIFDKLTTKSKIRKKRKFKKLKKTMLTDSDRKINLRGNDAQNGGTLARNPSKNDQLKPLSPL